jgi:hypothetical protein
LSRSVTQPRRHRVIFAELECPFGRVSSRSPGARHRAVRAAARRAIAEDRRARRNSHSANRVWFDRRNPRRRHTPHHGTGVIHYSEAPERPGMDALALRHGHHPRAWSADDRCERGPVARQTLSAREVSATPTPRTAGHKAGPRRADRKYHSSRSFRYRRGALCRVTSGDARVSGRTPRKGCYRIGLDRSREARPTVRREPASRSRRPRRRREICRAAEQLRLSRSGNDHGCATKPPQRGCPVLSHRLRPRSVRGRLPPSPCRPSVPRRTTTPLPPGHATANTVVAAHRIRRGTINDADVPGQRTTRPCEPGPGRRLLLEPLRRSGTLFEASAFQPYLTVHFRA